MQHERNDHQHRTARNGYDYDWTTGWRRVMSWGPGVGRYIKRTINKRARRAVKGELRGEGGDGDMI